MANPRKILVIGATGKQGGAVVEALLASPAASSIEILAVTRSPESASAKALLAKSANIKLIKGDLEHSQSIFEEVGKGVDAAFLMTMPPMSRATNGAEEAGGKDFVDAAAANGVKHLVFSSIDRHGARSDKDPTYVPHFASKHNIELHLKEKAAQSQMTWTILRPVFFLDNLQADFFGKIMATVLSQLGDKKIQMVATKDIGIVAAMALTHPAGFDRRAISLAGDELNYEEAAEVYGKIFKKQLPTTFGVLVSVIKWMLPDVGLMIKWFGEVGYDADIDECRRIQPGMHTFETWLKGSSR